MKKRNILVSVSASLFLCSSSILAATMPTLGSGQGYRVGSPVTAGGHIVNNSDAQGNSSISQTGAGMSNNSQALGYINPFSGTPGEVEKLTSQLAIAKLKNELAKQEALSAKLNSQTQMFNVDNSPALREVTDKVQQLERQIAYLKRAQQATVSENKKVALMRKNSKPKLYGIIENAGKKTAVFKRNGSYSYLRVGDPVYKSTIVRISHDNVTLSDGLVFSISPTVGHDASTGWKAKQTSGGIQQPTSLIARKLAAEAHASGMPKFGAANSQTIQMPGSAPGMPPRLP